MVVFETRLSSVVLWFLFSSPDPDRLPIRGFQHISNKPPLGTISTTAFSPLVAQTGVHGCLLSLSKLTDVVHLTLNPPRSLGSI